MHDIEKAPTKRKLLIMKLAVVSKHVVPVKSEIQNKKKSLLEAFFVAFLANDNSYARDKNFSVFRKDAPKGRKLKN